jgi:hypothetical protein
VAHIVARFTESEIAEIMRLLDGVPADRRSMGGYALKNNLPVENITYDSRRLLDP